MVIDGCELLSFFVSLCIVHSKSAKVGGEKLVVNCFIFVFGEGVQPTADAVFDEKEL